MELKTTVDVEYTPLNTTGRETGKVYGKIRNLAIDFETETLGANFMYYSEEHAIVSTAFTIEGKDNINLSYAEISSMVTPTDNYFEDTQADAYAFMKVKMASDFGIDVTEIEELD